jgi:hypothetical protein
MPTVPSFSAKHWIESNVPGEGVLRPGTFDAVSDFTLMWNLFEGKLAGPRRK